MSDRQHCLCCSHPVSSAGVYQTLYEMDFERGLRSPFKHVVVELNRTAIKDVD